MKIELKKKAAPVSAVMLASARAGSALNETERRSFISAVSSNGAAEAEAPARKLPYIPVAGTANQASHTGSVTHSLLSSTVTGGAGAPPPAAAADRLDAEATQALLREYGIGGEAKKDRGRVTIPNPVVQNSGLSSNVNAVVEAPPGMPALEPVDDPAAASWGPIAAAKLTSGSVDHDLLAKLFNPKQKRVVSGGMDGQTQPLLASSRVGGRQGGAAGPADLQQELTRYADDIDPLLRGSSSGAVPSRSSAPAAPTSFSMDDEDEDERGSNEEGDGSDPYARVHIEDFGAAMLRGMGVPEAAIEAAGASKSGEDEGEAGRARSGFAGSAFNAPPRRPKGLGLGAAAATASGGTNGATGGTTNGTSAAAAAGGSKAAAAAANKARKFPGLVEGAIVVLSAGAGSGYAGAVGLVTQTEGVPGLEKCRVRVLSPAATQGEGAAKSGEAAAGPTWKAYTAQDTALVCFAKAACTALAPQAAGGLFASALHAAVTTYADPSVLAVCLPANAAAGADDGEASAAVAAALISCPDALQRIGFLAAVEAASKKKAAPSPPAPAPIPAPPAPPRHEGGAAGEASEEEPAADQALGAELTPVVEQPTVPAGHAAAAETSSAASTTHLKPDDKRSERGEERHRSHHRDHRESDRHRHRDERRSRSRSRDRRDRDSERGRHHRDERDRERERDRRRSRSRSRDRRDRHSEHRPTSSAHNASSSSSSAPSKAQAWVLPGIRVRIADERHPAFKQKATVLSVSASGDISVTVQLDGTPAAEGARVTLPQRGLQTALPKAGGAVRLLRGPYRGAHARLLDRDAEAEEGTVQFTRTGTSEADVPVGAQLRLPLDDIAEYL